MHNAGPVTSSNMLHSAPANWQLSALTNLWWTFILGHGIDAEFGAPASGLVLILLLICVIYASYTLSHTHTRTHLHSVGDLCTCMFYCLSRFAVNLLPNCRRRRRLSKYRWKSRHGRKKRAGADAGAIAHWPSGHKTSSSSSSITNNVVNNKFIIFALP